MDFKFIICVIVDFKMLHQFREFILDCSSCLHVLELSQNVKSSFFPNRQNVFKADFQDAKELTVYAITFYCLSTEHERDLKARYRDKPFSCVCLFMDMKS